MGDGRNPPLKDPFGFGVSFKQALGELAGAAEERGDAPRFAESKRVATSQVVKKAGGVEFLKAARNGRLRKPRSLLYRSDTRSTRPLEQNKYHLDRAVLAERRE